MNYQLQNSRVMELTVQAVAQTPQQYLIIKRIQDIFLSFFALLVLCPFMLLVAVLIVLDSPGASPIFSQTRIGKNGKSFKFYKFRSMCPDAEEQRHELEKRNEMDGPVFKIKDDPRITRLGKILRKTSIDELPQLWNVFCGEMSIVGPRPALPNEVEQYDDLAKCRLLVTPGLTCYWQSKPQRNQLSFREWMQLDWQYIQDRSWCTDWKIIFATVNAVLAMSGE